VGELPRPDLGFAARKIASLFLPARPGAAPTVPFDPRAVERSPSITWIGHSAFLVRMDGVTFLTDPMLSRVAGPFGVIGPRRLVPPGVTLDALPPIDFVLLSHDHYDHADLPTVRRLARRGARFLVPRGLAEWVRRAGGEAEELAWWEETRRADCTIACVPAQHFSGRTPFERNRRNCCGWVVKGPTRTFYFVGDTGYTPALAEIGARFHPIHLAAVPIGAYLPASMMAPVHTTPEEALRIASDVRAERAVAMHFGTFDLTDEPLDEPPRRYRAEAEHLGLGPDRAWVLAVGETRDW
jgi:N-acyl-phosphatidylethanolamine-hydrolysing phospholipase D